MKINKYHLSALERTLLVLSVKNVKYFIVSVLQCSIFIVGKDYDLLGNNSHLLKVLSPEVSKVILQNMKEFQGQSCFNVNRRCLHIALFKLWVRSFFNP